MKQTKPQSQPSESVLLGIFLALAGGYMDAYSFLSRDGVFSNAQTGNIVLLGIHWSSGEWRQGITYLIPIAAFICGVVIAEAIRAWHPQQTRLHWRQTAILIEALIFLVVGLIPITQNRLASSLVSLACGIQVQAFQKTRGQITATVMCIGNLRSASHAFFDFMRLQNRTDFKRALIYVSIIVSFCAGAAFGNLCVDLQGTRAIWYGIIFLSLAYSYMFYHPDRERE